MPSTLGIALSGIQTAQFDPNALSFISAAAITDTTQKYAINNLVTDLKLNGLWTKMKAVYPMVGGNATSHSYNLKDTTQYQLTFSGGWTHGVTGAYPNGVNAGAQTGLNALSVLSGTSNHLSFYSLTDSKAGAGVGKVDIGCQIGPTTAYFVSISDYQLFVSYMYSNAAGFRIQIAEGTSASGFFLATIQSSSSFKAFSNRYSTSTDGFREIAQITTLQGSLPNNEIYLCRNGNTSSAYDYSDRGCGFASIGDGLSDSDAQTLGAIIQKYVNTLGRQQISIPTVQDINAQSFLVAAGITDSTQATALSNLTTNLKYYGLWSKMDISYPFLGGTSTSHKVNLKNPASNPLIFSGGWTHSSTGALPNGTNAVAQTGYTYNNATTNDTHLSYYSRTNSPANVGQSRYPVEIGNAVNTSPTVIEFNLLVSADISPNILLYSRQYSDPGQPGQIDGMITVSNTNSSGFYVGSRISSTSHKAYKNGSQIGSTNTTTNTYTLSGTVEMQLAKGAGGSYSNREAAFSSIGKGLSDTDVTNLNTIVQAYQTALSRQV